MRILVVLASVVLLGGCNVVVTEKPLFTSADEAGAPALKPGVWRLEDPDKKDCIVDEAAPLDQWPDCANGAVFSPGEVMGHDTKDGQSVWQRVPFVFAAGDPRIAQILLNDEQPGKEQKGYAYAAARPTAFDRQRRITAIAYWIVQCGPPPPTKPNNPQRPGKLPPMGTLHPLPGMIMKPGEAMCATTSVKALRGAAKASEAWADKPMAAHWVRDGKL